MQEQMKKLRNDKICFIRKDVMDAASQNDHSTPLNLTLSYCTHIKPLLDSLFSLPFELNKKSSLGLQICDSLCVDCFPEGSFRQDYMDSGFGSHDTGRKITMAYMVSNDSSNSIALKDSSIPIKHNSLLIYKSRKLKLSVPKASSKFFIVYFYIPGPCDPYQ